MKSSVALTFDRLRLYLAEDDLTQAILDELRQTLTVDRVVLYSFNSERIGQVTFESLSDRKLSILISSGADECFNSEYSQLYENGRIRAIADIESEPIESCHRDFLRELQVKANLVVPILSDLKLWGLLVAHHCQSTFDWSANDILAMQATASNLSIVGDRLDS
ncbi:GAF domain-containing protein [Chamaesiphon minutus]|uniref:GAF domain-containing protein n=1 Tax=Chamaesiphon minutus (strain ATCC 27169 / PCC 6605) TaxID=1173020 RepID=K9UJC8_CHAP6|nr:GAF domain-containing protein [Chamaesiphon minutus]AFY94566.1 GAF domain-containing protein [Chamaesiphon minutus PCC 6605]